MSRTGVLSRVVWCRLSSSTAHRRTQLSSSSEMRFLAMRADETRSVGIDFAKDVLPEVTSVCQLKRVGRWSHESVSSAVDSIDYWCYVVHVVSAIWNKISQKESSAYICQDFRRSFPCLTPLGKSLTALAIAAIYWGFETPFRRRAAKRQKKLLFQSCPMCGICDERIIKLNKEVHADHVLPYSRNGRTTSSNIQLAHAQCNQEKGAKFIPSSYTRKLAIDRVPIANSLLLEAPLEGIDLSTTLMLTVPEMEDQPNSNIAG